MSRLEARGLTLSRAGRVLIEDFDLSAGPGDTIAIVGPSGSGKTSLLAALAGLSPPNAGTVAIDGEPVRTHTIGIVLQGFGLMSLLTAAENVEVALRAAGVDPAAAQERADAALASVGLHELAGHLSEELSGGQQQRVAVARALAIDPAILIADEPTAEQDDASRAVVLDQLFAVAERGGTLVLATHDPEVAERCAVRVTVG